MFVMTGYQVVARLGSLQQARIYRLLRQSDGQRVIAKTTVEEHPADEIVSAYRRAYVWMTSLDGQGAAKPYELSFAGSRPVLLMEDWGGNTLDQMHPLLERDLKARLRIAVTIVDSLAQIHRAPITIQDIKPWQVLANPDTGEARWIDLTVGATHSPQLRANFSALGALLHEWLAGKRPLGNQSFELPRAILNVIDRCMEKRADSRYADALEIRSDLEACLSRLLSEETNAILSVVSTPQDEWGHGQVANRFYGRDAERALLQAAIRRVSADALELVWVSGYGGIGKTTFVTETLARDTSIDAWFAAGKFDSQHAALPYDVWAQALDQLVDNILRNSQTHVEVWKQRILQAADGYAQLMIDLVPRLQSLIGPQPVIQPLPPIEAQRRFHLVLKRFIQLFVQQGRPLVLFLDDLQWADEGSLQVLAYLLTNRDLKHLLIVCAYREDEIGGEHPLNRLKNQLVEQNVINSTIPLHELDVGAVTQLLADTLRPEAGDVTELAVVLNDKTLGNPFFLKRLLQDLLDRKHITYDTQTKRWHWDLQQIAHMDVAENAAIYMAIKLKHQDDDMADVLQTAAALGSQFTLDILFPLVNLEKDRVFVTLGQAVRNGFLLQIGGEKTIYKFQHDRIRQAAYSLIAKSDLPDLHLRIGSLLLRRLPLDASIRLYEALNHLNLGLERVTDPAQKLEAAQLNLQAGLQAKQATAYETALVYLRHATALLPETAWTDDYTLAFQVYREQAETEYLCAHYREAADLFDLLLDKAAANIDRALVYIMLIQLEASRDNYKEVIELGRKVLVLLNVRCNLSPDALTLALQWRKLARKLRDHPVETLDELPPMTDPVRKLVMSILVHTSHANYFVNKKGWASNILTMVETTLDYGFTPEAAVSYSGYALLLYYQFRQNEEAWKWGMLACSLSAPYPSLHVRALTVYALCIDSWRHYDPVHLTRFSDKAGKVALESGDLWQANQSLLLNCALLFQFSHPLQDIYERLVAGVEELKRHNNSVYWKQAVLLAALISRLRGTRLPDDPFVVPDFLDERFYRSVHGDRLNFIEEIVCLYRYITGYMFGAYRDANEALARASEIIKTRKENGKSESQCLYECLVWAQLYEESSAAQRISLGIHIRRNIRLLKRSSARCPENYLHKYLLAQAELARLQRHNEQASRLYEQSIAAAIANGHIHDEAIAAECLGKFSLRQGLQPQAALHLSASIKSYRQWGAEAKAAAMEREYGALLH